MIRWYPMARATSRLAGPPVYFDLTEIRHLTRTAPNYQPIVRDLETLRRTIRRKTFGVRVSADLGFEVPHTRLQNSRARWYEPGVEILVARNELDAGGAGLNPWQQFNSIIVTPNVAIGPRGLLTADKIEDANAGAIVFMKQRPIGILPTPNPITFLGGLFVRSDAPQNFSFGFSTDGTQSNVEPFTAGIGWRRFSSRMTCVNGGTSINFYIYPAGAGGPSSAVGFIYAAEATMKQIVELPGTDEEILTDLHAKLCSDDWDVDLTLDGGLTWREVNVDEHEKISMDDKWVGHVERFAFTATEIIQEIPATLDGIW